MEKPKKEYVESPSFFSKLDGKYLDNIHFVDMKIKDGMMVSGGTYGNLMCVCSKGSTPQDVNKSIIKILKDIEIYPMGYRNDIGLNMETDLASLRSFGFYLP